MGTKAEITKVTSLANTTITEFEVTYDGIPSLNGNVTIVSTSDGDDIGIWNGDHYNLDGFTLLCGPLEAALEALMEAVMG